LKAEVADLLAKAARHLIENSFAKIKQFRAIATRYEKTARNFLVAVQLVASVVWFGLAQLTTGPSSFRRELATRREMSGWRCRRSLTRRPWSTGL
jgi:hypothetical protein